jgi:hypothetical protein
LDELTGETTLAPAALRTRLTSALTALSGHLLELSLLQARARLDAVTFEPVDLTPEEGYCIASRHRRDWMNARAALVDSWRLVQFNANDLESDLDLVLEGDIGNASDNPFSLRGTDARLSAGLQFDPPLTRLAERNVYRQSLIEYQQARRNYYQFRDRVQRDVRGTLRQLRLDDLNFELRRAAVHVAITQVDLARLRLSEPARPVAASLPGQPTQPGGQSQFGDTVARDLVNALIDLLNVQNDFLSVWVDHEVQQLQLDFDLGVMELDAHGIRIEHEQPLRLYLGAPPNSIPCELPDACAEVPPIADEGDAASLAEPGTDMPSSEEMAIAWLTCAKRTPIIMDLGGRRRVFPARLGSVGGVQACRGRSNLAYRSFARGCRKTTPPWERTGEDDLLSPGCPHAGPPRKGSDDDRLVGSNAWVQNISISGGARYQRWVWRPRWCLRWRPAAGFGGGPRTAIRRMTPPASCCTPWSGMISNSPSPNGAKSKRSI